MSLPEETSSVALWGKRPRNGEQEEFVRFSDLSPSQKMERRRQERQEKKEKQRTLAYFERMQRALADCQQNVNTPGTEDINEDNTSSEYNSDNLSSARISMIDGFFSELFKLLRADTLFHLLRNNVVCKTIDAALANATLLHGKSLLHIWLGHAYDLITSPVASYTLEMLLISITHSLNNLRCNGQDDEFEQEMTLGSTGMHAGSGVASSLTLLSALTEEISESISKIVCHEVGARALRSILLILAGFSVHNAPPLNFPIRFSDALDELTEAIVNAIRDITLRSSEEASDSSFPPSARLTIMSESKQEEEEEESMQNTVVETKIECNDYIMWMEVAHASTTLSLIVQSLLKICITESKAFLLVQSSMEHAVNKTTSEKLLVSLLHNDKGVFLFQAYITIPTPAEIISKCDKLDFSIILNSMERNNSNINNNSSEIEEGVSKDNTITTNNISINSNNNHNSNSNNNKVAGSTSSNTVNERNAKKAKHRRKREAVSTNVNEDDINNNGNESENERLRKSIAEVCQCAWGYALRVTTQELSRMLSIESNEIQSLSYVLQDLTLYAPSSIHLLLIWNQIIYPNLLSMFEIPILAPVLNSFVKKCAFNGSVSQETNSLNITNNNTNNNNKKNSYSKGNTTSTLLGDVELPPDINEMLRHDETKGIIYFDVPVVFQEQVVTTLSTYMLSQATKGAVHYLLVENKLGSRGGDLARYLFHLHYNASIPIQNSVDKLRLDDLLTLLCTHKGSVAMQQFIRAAAQREMNAKTLRSKASKFSSSNDKKNNNNSSETSDTNHTSKQEGNITVSVEETEALRALPRFVRRIIPHLQQLASNTFAAFVIEVLYDVGSVELKEQLLHGLVPLYETMKRDSFAPLSQLNKHGNNNNNNNAQQDIDEEEPNNGSSNNPLMQRQQQFILRKVLRKCCVEQFVHRNADWRKAAERQAQVQRLMYRILLPTTQ